MYRDRRILCVSAFERPPLSRALPRTRTPALPFLSAYIDPSGATFRGMQNAEGAEVAAADLTKGRRSRLDSPWGRARPAERIERWVNAPANARPRPKAEALVTRRARPARSLAQIAWRKEQLRRFLPSCPPSNPRGRFAWVRATALYAILTDCSPVVLSVIFGDYSF